ncbi:MAG TPA: translocation/assembly module TamB domain-containing protein, partial [Flavobacteriaceae bacterium]|nr:translocation/assembly module TamB domain-containing protein [Flavobacteriaceae bacterium]
TDLDLSNIKNVDNAYYNGTIKFVDFKLGEVLNNQQVGKVTMEADIAGSGFTLATLNTEVKGKIQKLNYKGYSYNDITVDGVVKNQHFNGEVEVNDDNLKLNFNGLADLSTDVYKFNFKSIVDYSDLNAINLFNRDSIANFRGNIDINLQGNTIDNMVGSINFTNTLYTNQKQDYFFKDFQITSAFEDSVRVITINSSEIIEGRVRGNFKFNEVLKLTKNSIGSIYTNYKPFKVTSGQNLDFNFKIYNKIVEVFFPEVTLAANTTISGNIASDDNEFKLRLKSPSVVAYGTEVDSILLQIDNKNPLFNTQLSVGKVNSKLYDIHDFDLINRTINDTLYFRSEFKGGENLTETYNLSFYHTFNEENKSVFGLQQSDFTFKNNKWNINPDGNNLNKIVYNNKNDSYKLLPFTIVSGNQRVNIEGVLNDSISKDLQFNFQNVKLANITPHIDSLKINGELNGSLNYKEVNNQLKPTANLTVSNFKINNSYQGNLDVAIEGQNSLRNYNVNVSMERDGYKNLEITGNLNFAPQNPTLDLTANFEEFKLDAFSPLGKDVFSNIRGFAYGTATVKGSLKNPQMAGELYLDEAGMYFPLLNVDYDFKGTSVINLEGNSFVFEDVTLQDTKHQTTGNLVGNIYHNNFKTWNLALRVNTNNLLVLDTEPEEDSLYYGTGYLAGTATIFGPTDQLVVNVQGKTMPNTHFVIPLSDVKTVGSSKLIRFVNSEDEDQDEQLRRQFFSDKLKGFALNFNIEVTKDAVIEMVLDKSTGSYLKGSGTGNLQIEIDAQDKFNMYGDFIVDNGIYNFKYGGFINKPFIVRKGGSISWSGDPLTANLNIEAVHRVSANPRFLLENLSSSRKIPIDLVTRFSGELFDSQRDFDIEIPNSSSTVASELAFVLNENDQNRKTLHFMSLLATGSFFNETDFSVNANSFAYGTTSDLLSNAFDNIFNQGDNKFRLKPVYTVGERSRVDNIDIYDQLALDLAYQVNDRVLINGKVGVPIGSKEQSNVIGEVNVEFLLNEEGTLRSSIFNRQNEIQYTEQEEGYTQGVGLSYQIDFDTGKELLEKLGLKKKEEDSTAVNPAVDSIAITNKIVKFKTRKEIKNE